MFYPLATSSDDRSARGAVPLVCRNVLLEPQPVGSGKRTQYLLTPHPGRVSRVTPSSTKLVRGIFSRPGVQDGGLFVAVGNHLGSKLYSVSTSWTATSLGSIAGSSGTVLFDSVGEKLAVLASGTVYEYDAATGLQVNTDPYFPTNALTLASLGERLLTSEEGTDTFDWSSVSNMLSWPAAGFAASARMPDEIKAQAVVGGDLFHLGAATIQPWRAMGGDDPDAFDVLNVVIDRGVIGTYAWAKLDSALMFVGDDRVIYLLTDYAPRRVSNREIEQALADLTHAQCEALQAFSYMLGSHLIWVLRMPTGKAYAYDLMTQTWSERTTWGATRFAPSFYTYFHAAGKHVVASDEDDDIWSWEPETYTDNALTHERVMMVHVPVAQRTIISSVCLDLKCTNVPLSGTGSDPQAVVTFYTDGGSRDSLSERGVERTVSLGGSGAFNRRPIIRRLGMVNAADGILIKITIHDPVNFAFSGVWINEDPT